MKDSIKEFADAFNKVLVSGCVVNIPPPPPTGVELPVEACFSKRVNHKCAFLGEGSWNNLVCFDCPIEHNLS